MNSGVCIRGSNLSVDESDYYGQLEEIMESEYPALPNQKNRIIQVRLVLPYTKLGNEGS